jgi:hypothetical protein
LNRFLTYPSSYTRREISGKIVQIRKDLLLKYCNQALKRILKLERGKIRAMCMNLVVKLLITTAEKDQFSREFGEDILREAVVAGVVRTVIPRRRRSMLPGDDSPDPSPFSCPRTSKSIFFLLFLQSNLEKIRE